MSNPYARSDMDLLEQGYQVDRSTGLYQKDDGPWLSAIEARRAAGLLPPELEPTRPAHGVNVEALDINPQFIVFAGAGQRSTMAWNTPKARGVYQTASGMELRFDVTLSEGEREQLHTLLESIALRIRSELAS